MTCNLVEQGCRRCHHSLVPSIMEGWQLHMSIIWHCQANCQKCGADKVVYESIDCKSSDIKCLVKQMRKENVTVVGNKSVRNDAGEMSMSEDSRGGKAECVGWTLWKASQHWVWVGPWTPVQQTAARSPAYPNHHRHGERPSKRWSRAKPPVYQV